MERYIYKDYLPSFERYELFDPNEEEWKIIANAIPDLKGKGIRDISTLYIKGIKRIDNLEDKIEYKEFFNDYIELGKKLYNLAITEHPVHFTQDYEFDITTFMSNYIERKFWELDLTILQKKSINDIINLRESFEDIVIKDNNKAVYGILDLIDEILDLLFLLLCELDYEIEKYLNRLLEVIKSTIDMYNSLILDKETVKIFNLFFNCQCDLAMLVKEIKEIVKNSDIYLNKKVSLSPAKKSKVTKKDVLNKFEETPLTVIFTYYQIDDLQKIITEFIGKYGFPYYVFEEDEEKYIKEINRIIDLSEEDSAIPCDILILNSIFNYLLYTILTEWKTADDKIKKIWGFDDKKLKSKNVTTIHNVKKMCKYFNSALTSKLYGFKNYIENVNDENNFNVVSLNNEEDYDNCDNYFKGDRDEGYYKLLFNNLCIAANEILTKEYRYDKIDAKSKSCPNCGKSFIPSKDFRTYCCEKCQVEGRRKKKAENKRNERKNKNV